MYPYEETDEPQTRIAADYRISRKALDDLAKREGWRLRRDRAPRDLPGDVALSLKADRALEAAGVKEAGGSGFALATVPRQTPLPNPPPQGGREPAAARGGGIESHVPAEQAAASGEGVDSHQGAEPDKLSVAEQLEREVEAQLALVRSARMQLGATPRRSAEGESVARTLERLTDTLSKVQRLRSGAAGAAVLDDYDDIPGDIDEFREALARRIETFVRNRMGADIPPGGESCDPASA